VSSAAKRHGWGREAAAANHGVEEVLAALPQDVQGARDRALLLVGFAGSLGPSELARLRMEELPCLTAPIR
jgi:hypothetical protein